MEERLPLLRTLPLFAGMTEGEILQVLELFRGREMRFGRAEFIWEPFESILWGIVLEGKVTLLQEDSRGNRTTVDDIGPGGLLDGKAIAKADAQSFCLSVHGGSSVLLFDREAVMNPAGSCSRVHLLLLRNTVEEMTQRKAQLLQKINYLGKRTTREKLLSFLSMQAALHGTRRFNVPYTRQELANLLAVDRSAMCTELTHMQNDGLIRFERNRFELLVQ